MRRPCARRARALRVQAAALLPSFCRGVSIAKLHCQAALPNCCIVHIVCFRSVMGPSPAAVPLRKVLLHNGVLSVGGIDGVGDEVWIQQCPAHKVVQQEEHQKQQQATHALEAQRRCLARVLRRRALGSAGMHPLYSHCRWTIGRVPSAAASVADCSAADSDSGGEAGAASGLPPR